MKLNLGSGDEHVDGFVSVDMRRDCGAGVVADVTRLCFADDSIEVIAAADILEHFPATRSCRILREWWRVLCADGALLVRVPNMLALAEALIEDELPRGAVIRNIYGGHRWGPEGAWDTHHTGWCPPDLERLLEDCGFVVVHNDRGLNMTVEARKAA